MADKTNRQTGMKERQENRIKQNGRGTCSKAVRKTRDRRKEVPIDSKTGRPDSQRLLYVNI